MFVPDQRDETNWRPAVLAFLQAIKASFWLSPIGFLGRFGRKSSETLGFRGKGANAMPKRAGHLGNPDFEKQFLWLKNLPVLRQVVRG